MSEIDVKNYTLLEAVAVGAESVLYRAEDKNGYEFCVKAIRRFLKHHHGHVPIREKEAKLSYERKKKHLVNEFNVGRALHVEPQDAIINIFHLHELKVCGWEWGCDLLIEYLSGEDLGKTTFVRALSLRDKIDFLIQCAEAIHNLHTNGYVHLDVKPQNFMVTRGRIKIIDFGTTVPRGTVPGRMMGTPGYLPPEQVLGSAPATESNDVFSFGVSANEILGGRKLRQDVIKASKRQRNFHAAFTAQSEQSPLPSIPNKGNHVPKELTKLFQKCTIPKVSSRYQSMQPVIHQLKDIAERHQLL